MDNEPKHTAEATQDYLKAYKLNILQWPSPSPDLNPIDHAFQLLKTRLKAERPTNKQQVKVAAKHLQGGDSAFGEVHGLQTTGSH